jgi:hypothetical protein
MLQLMKRERSVKSCEVAVLEWEYLRLIWIGYAPNEAEEYVRLGATGYLREHWADAEIRRVSFVANEISSEVV